MIWIKLLLTAPNIYSIKVPTTIIPDWMQISIPSGSKLMIRKDTAVASISELSGIRGTDLMVALRIMTAVNNPIIIVAIQADLHHRQTTFLNIQDGTDMVPVCLLMVIVGNFCTGHFEMNLMDKFHTIAHYTGVTLIFAGSLSCGFMFDWNLLSICLLMTQFGLGLFYAVLKKGLVPRNPNDIREVTRISKICIAIELLMFQVTNVILVLTIYASGANEGNLFASPFIEYDSVVSQDIGNRR